MEQRSIFSLLALDRIPQNASLGLESPGELRGSGDLN